MRKSANLSKHFNDVIFEEKKPRNACAAHKQMELSIFTNSHQFTYAHALINRSFGKSKCGHTATTFDTNGTIILDFHGLVVSASIC